MATETASPEKIGKVVIDFTKPKTYVFVLTENKRTKPMGVTAQGDWDPPYPRKYFLDNPVQTIDPVTKKPRWARALKGIDTIWQDEQKDIPKEQIPQMLDEFAFMDGHLFIDMPMEYSRLKYLLHHIDFVDNTPNGQPPTFTIVNDDEKAEKEYKQMELVKQAEDKAMEMPMEDLLPMASFFGIKVKDSNNEDRKETAIRLDFVKVAQQKPGLFLKTATDAKMKIRHAIEHAIDKGIIDLNRVKGQAHWKETGALITALNPDDNPVDFLVAFSLKKGKESTEFMKKLEL